MPVKVNETFSANLARKYASRANEAEPGFFWHYEGNIPIKYVDPDGRWIESAWDLVSLVMGVESLSQRIKEGGVLGGIIAGAGIALDVVALALPGPAGAGAGLRAYRALFQT